MTTDVTDARAVWSTAFQNDLPDSSFAYIEPGGKKDASGRTMPRTLRHLPYKDASGKLDEAHVRNALARLPQTDISESAKASAHAKIIAAAKKLGIEVEDEESARAVATATDTRAVGSDVVQHVFSAPITRVDPEKRLVTVTATSEAVDSFGTIFDYEASKDAFQRWVGNVREMHQPKAVGTRVGVVCDDAHRKIDVTLRVSKGAQDTWEKILDGTLKGASIGASNATWVRPANRSGGQPVARATKYDLIELSLVDNPSNPDSLGITLVRNALPDTDVLDDMNESENETPTTEERAAVPTATEDEQENTQNQNQPLPPMVGSASTEVDLGPLTARNSEPDAEAMGAEAPVDPIAVGRAMRPRRTPTGQQSAWIAKADADNTRALLAEEIRRAGDAAEASVGPLMLGEDFPSYAARVAQARGLAESKALIAQKQRLRAEREQAAATAAPTTTRGAESETTTTTVSAPGDEEQRSRMPRTVSSAPAAAPAKSEDGNMAVVETSDRPADSATKPGVAPSAGASAVGAQATMRDEEMHEHDHEHIAPDGARTVHRHPHGHAEAGHDHMHTYRAGEPTDARLVSADILRAGSGMEQSAKSDGYSAASKARPVSGSAQKSGAAESGLAKMTPDKVGHPVGYNTETVEAFPFGVPEEADGRESGDEELQLNPADFHAAPAGGPTTSSGPIPATAAPMIASRPPEPSTIAREENVVGERTHERAAKPTSDKPMSVDDGRRPGSGVSDTSDEDAEPPAGGDADEQPGYAESEGEDSDADDVRETAKPEKAEQPAKPTKPTKRAVSEPTDTRKGARLSAESMGAVHNMRDTAQQTIEHACDLCGCPECKGLLAVIHGGPYNALGNHDASPSADTADDTALFGQLRVAQALVTRLLAEQQARHEEQLAQMREQMEQQAEEMRAALADMQLTVVDHQRGYAAQVTRAMQSQFAETISQTVTQTTQAFTSQFTSQIERQMPEVVRAVVQESVAQHLTGLAASVAEVKAGVETIASQPASTSMSSGAPVFGGADKVLALHTRANGGAHGQPSAAEEIGMWQRLATNVTDQRVQTAIATRIMALQGQTAR